MSKPLDDVGSFSALVDEEFKRRLQRAAKVMGLPQDSVLRLIIDDWLRQQSLQITELPDLRKLLQ